MKAIFFRCMLTIPFFLENICYADFLGFSLIFQLFNSSSKNTDQVDIDSGAHIFFSHSDKFSDFDQEFNKQFNQIPIWLVLANDGEYNPHIERFKADNWLFWGNPVQEKILGISGNYFSTDTWKQLEKRLSKKISYIAADFNELVSHKHRNEILKAASNVLDKDGIFCLEDTFDTKSRTLTHFSKTDLEHLSDTYDIKFAIYDGFVASLPYVSNLSNNQKKRLFEGLERCILKLSACPKGERHLLGLNLSTDQLNSFPILTNDEIIFIISDLINNKEFSETVAEYQNKIKIIEETENDIKKTEKELEAIQNDLKNLNQIKLKYKKAKKTLTSTKNKALSLIKRIKLQTNKNDYDDESLLNSKIEEKSLQKEKSDIKLSDQRFKLSTLKLELQELESRITSRQEEVFAQFSNDRYLINYTKYKKNKIEDIIKSNFEKSPSIKEAAQDEAVSSLQKRIEKLANTLRNAWSPQLVKNQSIDFGQLNSFSSSSIQGSPRILVILIKKQDKNINSKLTKLE